MPADVTPAPQSPVSLPDSTPLHRLIGRTRRLLRGSWVATGLGITLGLALGTLAVLAVLDLFVPLEPITLPLAGVVVPLDPILRCVALFLIVVPAALAFLQGVVRPLFRRLAPTLVARRIESHLPGIHNRLVSAIDLEKADPATEALAGLPAPPAHRGARAHQELPPVADPRLRQPPPRRPRRRRRRAARRRRLGPVLRPPADRPGPHLQPVRRHPARLRRRLRRRAGHRRHAPQRGHHLHRPRRDRATPTPSASNSTASAAPRLRYDLKQDRNDPAVFRVVVDGSSLGKGFEDGFRYRVYGGRTWSKQQAITLVDRPVIAGVRTQVVYPKYMKIPQPQPTPPQAVAVAGPEGTKDDPSFVEVVVTSQHDVARGEIQLLEPSIGPHPAREAAGTRLVRGQAADGVLPGRQRGSSPRSPAARPTPSRPASAPTATGSRATRSAWPSTAATCCSPTSTCPPTAPPEAIMLEWHDGDGWEHRAYWGADKIREGKAGTASRYHAGDAARRRQVGPPRGARREGRPGRPDGPRHRLQDARRPGALGPHRHRAARGAVAARSCQLVPDGEDGDDQLGGPLPARRHRPVPRRAEEPLRPPQQGDEGAEIPLAARPAALRRAGPQERRDGPVARPPPCR